MTHDINHKCITTEALRHSLISDLGRQSL